MPAAALDMPEGTGTALSGDPFREEGEAQPAARPAARRGVARRDSPLADLLAPVRRWLAVATALTVIAAVAAVVPFVAVAELGRTLLGAPSGEVDEERAWDIVQIAVLALGARFGAMGLAGLISHLADNTLQLVIRRRMAETLSRVPLGWFTDRSSGQVKTAVQDDVTILHHQVAHARNDLVTAVVTPLVALGYLFSVDWRLTLVTLTPLPVYAGVYALLMRGFPEKIAQYSASLGRVNAAVVEFVSGIAVVKTFGQARRAHDRFLREADDFADFFAQWAGPMTRIEAVGAAVIAPATMLLVTMGVGTAFVAAGSLPAVDLLPFALLAVGLTAPLLALSHGAEEMRAARAAAGRIAALLATPTLPAGGVARPDGHRVELADVWFGYGDRAAATHGTATPDDPTLVLRGVSAVLEPGTITALVGPSGAGKSTLASLVPRFHDVTGGAVRIGGVDVRDIAPHTLYQHVGFVFQDVSLLRMSVRDNIRLARPDADDTAVIAAARSAQIHERILRLPRGYDTVIGQDAELSGGEAQRVSIARALLADPPVLVLDEATAFSDPESEAAITEALSELAVGRTVLVIAHRLSTIVDVDQILVLIDGRIAERGRHHQLLASAGAYARMWRALDPSGQVLLAEGEAR